MDLINEVVRIKNGNKVFDFKNHITSSYLHSFLVTQLSIDELNTDAYEKDLNLILLKIDTPLEIEEERDIMFPNAFDYMIKDFSRETEQISSEIQITMNYKMDNFTNLIGINKSSTTWNALDGHRITGIGFVNNLTSYELGYPIFAYLDLQNYSINIYKEQKFELIRRDTIKTNAEFYSPFNEIKTPIHLLIDNGIDKGNNKFEKDVVKKAAILKYIGLSNYKDKITEVYSAELLNDLIGNALAGFKALENPDNKNLLYPSEKLYPSKNLFPTKAPYKYLIFKYETYVKKKINGNESEYMLDGKYYHMIIEYKKFGNFRSEIKYERG